MGSNGAEHIPMSEQMDGCEPTIEIKIKTLDSQTYTLKVDKEMPVPALKEQIASVTGVLSEQQRLICRGKVLKDDQLLSAYHVEDGHTLHLVVRQPIPPSSEGLLNHSATDPASSTSRGRSSVFIESFSVPVQGDGVPPDFSRFLSAVLGSVGIPSIASGSEGVDVTDPGTQRPERTSGLSGLFDLSQLLSEQATTRAQSDGSNGTFGHSAPFSLGNLPPLVIPDSLNTLSRYLSHIRRDFLAIARDGGRSQEAIHRNDESSNSSSGPGIRREGIPSPASLAEVIRTARLLLIEQAGESLLRLASQLENQANVTDPSARMRTQASALRTGTLYHNLGACLLELGRTMMTLQMGQTPSDAVVNAGPAVFISPTGPNPIMVQPLPFQSGMSLGAIPMGALQPGSGLLNGLGSGFHPRRIDIQIRRGSPTTTANVNREEHRDLQQPSQRNSAPSSGGENPANQTPPSVSDGSALAGDSGVRVVPVRTVVASRLPSESAGSSIGLYYPFLGRLQHVASGNVNGERGSQASGDHHPAGLHTDRQSSENITDPARDGSTPNIRQPDPPTGRSVSISFLSSGGTQNDQESERQVPSGILNLLRALFPGGEIHVEDGSVQGMNSSSVSDQARTSNGVAVAPEAEPRVSEEGIFLSNLLHQVMPLISQAATREPGLVPAEAENSSEHTMAQDSSTVAENSNVGTSRRHSQSDCDEPPSSKRQKKE
ncbi:putative ubiquitin [Rosa chinensis]|uniref:Putative ubiquitin n=1 Tax=Rosa chinensis TaxID=74649 RepID=A0A2P6RIG2_ROSCH|nr:ubiquitin-like domain-containing protein CIP73 [Rosa chinensis]PRQ46230.1 putative ubiquitin [Rosa chinensis]